MASGDRQQPRTTAGQFLAKRGIVLTKQFMSFGKIKCEFDTTLSIHSLVITTKSHHDADRSYGVRLEHEDRDEFVESCLVDADEIVELLHAIRHITQEANDLASQRVGYTEVEYRTKDDLRIGFFQTIEGRQTFFVDVAPGGSQMFLGQNQIKTLFDSIKAAAEELKRSGAT